METFYTVIRDKTELFRSGVTSIEALEHFCCRRFQFPDHKIRFLAFFEAKMTKIVILDHKLIVSDDYQ